jgi:hypothetical protein
MNKKNMCIYLVFSLFLCASLITYAEDFYPVSENSLSKTFIDYKSIHKIGSISKVTLLNISKFEGKNTHRAESEYDCSNHTVRTYKLTIYSDKQARNKITSIDYPNEKFKLITPHSSEERVYLTVCK